MNQSNATYLDVFNKSEELNLEEEIENIYLSKLVQGYSQELIETALHRLINIAIYRAEITVALE